MKINSLSEFKITESSSVVDESIPFIFSYYTLQSAPYIASWDGEVYTNCKRQEDGSLLVIFENHNLNCGELWVRRDYFIADNEFADGVQNISSTERCPIELTMGGTTATQADIDYIMPYAKGASAYEVAVEEGFEGSATEWLKSLSYSLTVVENIDSEVYNMSPSIVYTHIPLEEMIYPEIHINIEPTTETNPLTDEYILIFEATQELDGFYDHTGRNIKWIGSVDSWGNPFVEVGKTYEINIVGSRGVIVGW